MTAIVVVPGLALIVMDLIPGGMIEDEREGLVAGQ
jgi:hypothetical protein